MFARPAGTTVELIGLGHLASGAEPRLLTATVGKEDLLKDIQFRSVETFSVSVSRRHPRQPCQMDAQL